MSTPTTPRAELHTFLTALSRFRAAAYDVTIAYQALDPAENGETSRGFPFRHSFDEVTNEIDAWSTEVAARFGMTASAFIDLAATSTPMLADENDPTVDALLAVMAEQYGVPVEDLRHERVVVRAIAHHVNGADEPATDTASLASVLEDAASRIRPEHADA